MKLRKLTIAYFCILSLLIYTNVYADTWYDNSNVQYNKAVTLPLPFIVEGIKDVVIATEQQVLL